MYSISRSYQFLLQYKNLQNRPFVSHFQFFSNLFLGFHEINYVLGIPFIHIIEKDFSQNNLSCLLQNGYVYKYPLNEDINILMHCFSPFNHVKTRESEKVKKVFCDLFPKGTNCTNRSLIFVVSTKLL